MEFWFLVEKTTFEWNDVIEFREQDTNNEYRIFYGII